MQNSGDIRDEYIAQVVPGRSFADVGGLWGVINEKVSVAHKLGAISVTMIDVKALAGDLWRQFQERMSSLGITNYHCISKDICELQLEEIGQPFDVVHCSGVLYHHPNPMLVLKALNRITREHLILTSATAQEVVQNENGRYQIPSSGVIFIPALDDSERKVLKEYWERVAVAALGITEKYAYRVEDFSAWWWLPTSAALRAMCTSVGFRILDSAVTWGNNALTLLLGV